MKDGESNGFPWLTYDRVPTLGTWLRSAGYSTHYFGKWHLSHPSFQSLDKFGFDDWELSFPEPHGSLINNLGIYRDPGFVDTACAFINRQGCGVPYTIASAKDKNVVSSPPWFSVVSLVNPHDIATYPALIGTAISQSPFGPLDVPKVNELAKLPEGGTISIMLNKNDFPQMNAKNEKTWNESLENKPSCQMEYAYKMGFALSAKNGLKAANALMSPHDNIINNQHLLQFAADVSLKSTIPFVINDKLISRSHSKNNNNDDVDNDNDDEGKKEVTPEEASLKFIQFYAYLHSLMDHHMNRVLQALKDSGQEENTIVIFVADHGEYAASHHMMMEKWHTAYEEIIHVPAVIKLPTSASTSTTTTTNSTPIGLRYIDSVTSHVDILPTILGLAGLNSNSIEEIANKLESNYNMDKKMLTNLPGVDLSSLLLSPLPSDTTTTAEQHVDIIDNDGTARKGVLFINYDEITAPLENNNDNDIDSQNLFAVYNQIVEKVSKNPKIEIKLTPSSVKQPNNLHCVRSNDNYKLVNYFDPNNKVNDEWEMYDLSVDEYEEINLLNYQTGEPLTMTQLEGKKSAAAVKLTTEEIKVKSDELKKLLDDMVKKNLY